MNTGPVPIAQPLIGPEEKAAVLEVLGSGTLAQGPRVATFEAAFAAYCGVKHAIATSSGTTALHLALLSQGIGPGDEVITTPFTFIASANAILYVGAKPVFVDIDPETFNIDPDQIERAVTPRTRAILPVHLFGLPADMGRICAIAAARGLAVIEDACQAHGAQYRRQKVGSFGTGCFSFYATKNMTAGEGGMITTNDDEIAERCRFLRQHGMRRRYHHEALGFNFRMTELQAAIGLVQLTKLDGFNAARRANAALLSERLRTVQVPVAPDSYTHVFHQYTVRVRGGNRDRLLVGLREAGIGAEVYYPGLIYHQEPYRAMGYHDWLPAAEQAVKEVISLPVHPALTPEDLDRIVEGVNRLC